MYSPGKHPACQQSCSHSICRWMNVGSMKCVCACISLGCNCVTQPSPTPHHFSMHYLMTLSVAKVMCGALLEWYCPGNLSTGRKMCRSVELSTASLMPTVTTQTTDTQIQLAVQISDVTDTSPPVSQSVTLPSSIHCHCVLCTTSEVSYTRRSEISNQTYLPHSCLYHC